jgi:hypothetical protein
VKNQENSGKNLFYQTLLREDQSTQSQPDLIGEKEILY